MRAVVGPASHNSKQLLPGRKSLSGVLNKFTFMNLHYLSEVIMEETNHLTCRHEVVESIQIAQGLQMF